MQEFIYTAIVTGANSGLGFETTKAFVRQNIKVVMACRNLKKAEQAKNKILKSIPNAHLEIIPLDLNSLDSVRAFANTFQSKHKSLNILVNNAGFLANKFELSADGFESQLASNFLGHYLLTGLLLNTLKNSENARIVSVSSLAHRFRSFDLNRINNSKKYFPFGVYADTKLACLSFSYQLHRKLEAKGLKIISTAAHPGVSRTNISNKLPKTLQNLQAKFGGLIFSDMAEGAESLIYAALDLTVKGGSLYGPSGLFEIKGKPKKVNSNKRSKDQQLAEYIWRYAEEATGFKYDL